jgi:hypothetical protein
MGGGGRGGRFELDAGRDRATPEEEYEEAECLPTNNK